MNNEEFAQWVAKMIFDTPFEDMDFDTFSELACRKLEKLGLVEMVGDEWHLKAKEEQENEQMR